MNILTMNSVYLIHVLPSNIFYDLKRFHYMTILAAPYGQNLSLCGLNGPTLGY